MNWIQFLLQLTIIAVIGFVFKYLGEKYIIKFFDTQTKIFQLELDKSKIQFTKLHEKRAEVIEKMYELIVLLHRELENAARRFNIGVELSPREKLQNAGNRFNQYQEYYSLKNIYFDKSLRDNLDKISGAAWSVLIDLQEKYKQYNTDNIEERKKHSQEVNEAFKRINNNLGNVMPEIEKQLLNEFQILLGVLDKKEAKNENKDN